jgi:hypothetical protein
MRTIVVTFAILCTLSSAALSTAMAGQPGAFHDSAFSRMAPADEYFGRLKESVLEIRNRLDDLDRRSGDEMLDPNTRHSLDDLQDCIHDWQRKYPGDPWLPSSLHRLLRDYQRAGVASTDDATVPADQPEGVSVQGMIVDALSGQPIAGAFIVVETVDDAAPTPLGTTGDDGSFVIADLPATTLRVTVQPPEDSGYAPYTFTVDGSSGNVDAGVIRLTQE